MNKLLFFLIGFWFYISAAQSAPEAGYSGDIRVQIEGMACPFCAFGIEKHLKRIPGVTTVKIDLAGGTARLSIAPGKNVSGQAIREAVNQAGFKASEIGKIEPVRPDQAKVTATGQLEEDRGLFFLVSDDGKRYLLYDRPLEQDSLLSPGMLTRLQRFAAEKTPVRIEGTAHAHKDFSQSLLIQTVEKKP